MKEAAGVSALFIWVNSLSGLSGQIISGVNLYKYSLVGLAFRWYCRQLLRKSQMENKKVKYFLALVLTPAELNLYCFNMEIKPLLWTITGSHRQVKKLLVNIFLLLDN